MWHEPSDTPTEAGRGGDALLDTDLLPLDDELGSAGSYARRAHAGTTQPTVAFARALRGRLLADMGSAAGVAPGAIGAAVSD